MAQHDEFFFIERENMPCIYELSWDEKTPAITVKIHRDFAGKHPVPICSPIVSEFMNRFGFSNFIGDFFRDTFGFDGAFAFHGNENQFVVFKAKIPVAEKVAEKKCDLCFGDCAGLFGRCQRCEGKGKLPEICPICEGFKHDEEDRECLECSGKGVKTYIDWKSLYSVSASFTVFFSMASTTSKSESVACSLPQLILVNTATAHESNSLDGTYSVPLARWLASVPPNTEIIEVTKAMVTVWKKMFGGINIFNRAETWATVAYKNGWLNVSCPGDRCSLHPAHSSGPKIGRGYDFFCHNVDTPAQQITLLSALAALCDKAKIEIKL